LELRIAAHPNEDALIVDKAKSDPESKVCEGNALIAKWVPVLQRGDAEFLGNPQFVSRRNEQGRVELLVLVDANAITEKHVVKISSGRDRFGRLALHVQLDDAGGIKLRDLTQKNLSTSTCTRYVAEIMDGEVYAAPEILSTVRHHFQIPGDFTEAMIDEIAERAGNQAIGTYTSPPPYSITVTPLRILISLTVLLVLVFGSLPTRGLSESEHPRAWIVFGIVVGALIGGYLVGVTKTTGSPNLHSDIPPWGELIQINILGVLFGSAIGGALGMLAGYLLRFIVRRAIHNMRAIIGRAFSSNG
jgi:hypothetical protein